MMKSLKKILVLCLALMVFATLAVTGLAQATRRPRADGTVSVGITSFGHSSLGQGQACA